MKNFANRAARHYRQGSVPGALVLSLFLSFPLLSAQAETYHIDRHLPQGGDCPVFGQWLPDSSTCQVTDPLLVSEQDIINIEWATLLVESPNAVNAGVINVGSDGGIDGTLTITGELFSNFGKIVIAEKIPAVGLPFLECPAFNVVSNVGVIINDGYTTCSVSNHGVFENNGLLHIDGVFENHSFLGNNGTVDLTNGSLYSYASLINSGTIEVGHLLCIKGGTMQNYGTLNILGSFFNWSRVDNWGTIINDGFFETTCDVSNFNLIRNNGHIDLFEDPSCPVWRGIMNHAVMINDGRIDLHDGRFVLAMPLHPGSVFVNTSEFNAFDGYVENWGVVSNSGTINNGTPWAFDQRGILNNVGAILTSGGFDNYNSICLYNGGFLVGAIGGNPPLDTVDSDGDGACDECDCASNEPLAWWEPSEVRNLRVGEWFGTTTLSWDAPWRLGGEAVFYDLLATDTCTHDFGSSAECVESDLDDTATFDLVDPDPGMVRYYLVQADNLCPGAEGGVGFAWPLPDGYNTPRVGRPCP